MNSICKPKDFDLFSDEAVVHAKRNDDFCYVWDMEELGGVYITQYIQNSELPLVTCFKEGTVECEIERLKKDGFKVSRKGTKN